MADFSFTASPNPDSCEPIKFDASSLRLFKDYRFGIYSVGWEDEGEIKKTVEYNPRTGERYAANRYDTSLSFDEAVEHINKLYDLGERRPHGLILYMPEDLVCVDFDGTDSEDTPEALRDAHRKIISYSPTWVERSISGAGYHAFYRIQPAELAQLTNTNNKDKQIDTRVVNGFVFLTGEVETEDTIAPFDSLQPQFRTYLHERCAIALEAATGSDASWREFPDHDDIHIIKRLFKRYPDAAEFFFTRQDQTDRSELHFQFLHDLIRCSLNYEQVKRIYITSECAEFAYRSENRRNNSQNAYEKWLVRNIHAAAQDLVTSGRFFNPEEIFIGDDEDGQEVFEASWSTEIVDYTPTDWIIQDILPAKGVGSLYGPPGSGKTFLCLDMMAAISCANPWFDRRTKQVPVTYLGLEGAAGLRNRVFAYRQHHGTVGKMLMITEKLNILNSDDVIKLLKTMTKHDHLGGVLCIDTMSKSAPGMNENDSAEMSRYIAAVEDLAKHTYGCVLLVHHSGKDTDRGPRGHSSFLAGIDSAIEVGRDEGKRVWRTKKVKDGSDDSEEAFILEPIEIGLDQWGVPTHSCVVKPAPKIEEFLNGVIITDQDCHALLDLMIASKIEYFSANKGPNSVYSLLNELPLFPKWDKKHTDSVVQECINRHFMEPYEFYDHNNNRKKGVRPCI